jgi:hypothetical protein
MRLGRREVKPHPKPETMADARRADRISSRTAHLAAAALTAQTIAEEQRKLVAGLRRDGVSWGRIARILGVSRQAAQQRFSKKS